MSRINLLRTTIQEIINVATKSEVLADKKSNLFCKNYLNLTTATKPLASTSLTHSVNDHDESIKLKLFQSICNDHGFKYDKLYTKVINYKEYQMIILI